MKPFAALFAVLSISAVSCRETAGTESAPERVSLEFSVAVEGSSRSSVSEDAVGSLDVLVFDKFSGLQEASARSSGQESVSVSVRRGVELEYRLVANAAAGTFAGVKNLEDYASLSSPLSSNSPGAFLMAGGGNSVFEASASVKVSLSRMVSKVELGSVTAAFSSLLPSGTGVTLQRVFLVNVASGIPFSLAASSSCGWLCKMGPDSSLASPLDGFLTSQQGLSFGGTTPLECGVTLYCCPNPVDNGVNSQTNPSWSVRNTRLVLELLVSDRTCYYPITLPAMKPNTCYKVNQAVLTGFGSSHPDIPVSGIALSGGIVVSEWDSETLLCEL